VARRRASAAHTAAAHDRDSVLRAAAGALLGALPLLYTMEMWWLGETTPSWLVLVILAVTVPIVLLGLLFSGFRRGVAGRLGLDIPIVVGVSVVCAAMTLLILGRLRPDAMPLAVMARIVGIETVPCAIGASIAITQLRTRSQSERIDRHIHALPQDLQKIFATLVGAVFFAFNIAPTEEVRKMTIEAAPELLPLIVVFSILSSQVIVFLADFADRPPHCYEGVLGNPLAETFVSYLISLMVSFAFIHAYGHVSASTPFDVQLAMTVVLGYVTTLGAAAGRVLVAEQ
jgi:putative integral membrane protein (TIGR02587 family)